MLQTKELSSVIDVLDDSISTLSCLKDSLVLKYDDIERRCEEPEPASEQKAEAQKVDYEQLRKLESIAYDIISRKDTGFIINLAQFIRAYDLKCAIPNFDVDDCGVTNDDRK